MVTKEDLIELKRISTNAYNDEKTFINRLITKINNMTNVILTLQNQLKKP